MTALAVEPQNPAASTRLGEIISDQEQFNKNVRI